MYIIMIIMMIIVISPGRSCSRSTSLASWAFTSSSCTPQLSATRRSFNEASFTKPSLGWRTPKALCVAYVQHRMGCSCSSNASVLKSTIFQASFSFEIQKVEANKREIPSIYPSPSRKLLTVSLRMSSAWTGARLPHTRRSCRRSPYSIQLYKYSSLRTMHRSTTWQV